MPITLAFDIYGTLIDTDGVTEKLAEYIEADAADFAQRWRNKQLEYSFRRGLMRRYEPFAVCTRQALDYTCSDLQIDLSEPEKHELMRTYKTLPAFGDVQAGLESLQSAQCAIYAFSNGTREAVDGLLVNAKIRNYFLDIISVDEIRSFKPDPEVYRHFLLRTGSPAESAWLISSNAFDVIGAQTAGFRSVWIRRSERAVFDSWDIRPTKTAKDIRELSALFVQND